MRSCVKINLTNENLIIKLNEEAEYKEIVESLKKKITQLKKLYKDSKMPILIIGKNLKEQERVEIKNIIQEKIDVKISFEMPQELGLHGIKKTFCQEIEASKTKFHKGSVRSGQKIEYDGSIVILGDVNGDGIVDSKDITQILRYISNKSSVVSTDSEDIFYRKYVANVTALSENDTIIDSKDATQILRYISNKTSVFDCVN